MLKIILPVILLPIILLFFASCGSDDSSVDTDTNIGWLEISSYSKTTSRSNKHVEGTAFINSRYVAHNCAGFCCLLCYYDDSYPGVDVSWKNNTNNLSGTAKSKYGTKTSWEHLWSTSIPLVLGANYIDITASDPDGNFSEESIQIDYHPPAPSTISTDSGNRQITLEWETVPEAEYYNLYWSTESGVTKSNGIMITSVESPFVHSGIVNGVTYYYVITSLYTVYESTESVEISALAGAPPRPTGVIANTADEDIVISWNDSPSATSYSLYWSHESNLSKESGTQITDISSPYTHTGLVGLPYYYFVTAVNEIGESTESLEVTATPNLPPPPPTGLTAQGFYGRYIIIEWNNVPSAKFYRLYKCKAGFSASQISQCLGPLGNIYSGSSTSFSDRDVLVGRAYRYSVKAENQFGISDHSESISAVLKD